ncbi:MAG: ATP-binding protein [Prolixibacteraceae bacterium]
MLKRVFSFQVAFLIIIGNVLAVSDSSSQLLPDTFNLKNAQHYISYSANLVNNGELDKAKMVIELGLNKASEEKNDYLNANLGYYLADYYYYKQEYDSAHQLYFKVLPLFENLADTLMLAKTLNSIGLIYSFEQNNEKTLQYYLQEVELLNNIKKRSYKLDIEKMVLLTNIINVYGDTKQHEEVLLMAKEAIALAHEINDSVRLGSVLNTVALAQKNLGQIEQSLATFLEASRLFVALKDEFRNSFIINNIGGIFEMDNRNLDSALYYYTKALAGFEQNDYDWGISQAKLGVASVSSKKGNYKIAEQNYQEIIDLSKEHRFNQVLAMAYQGYAQMEYQKANYKKAYELNSLYQVTTDSLFNAEKQKNQTELETKYKIVQKENEINLLKNEKLSQDIKLEKANLQHFASIILLIFLLIVIYFYVIYYNRKRRANQVLLDKNKQIEQQNIQLTTMNEHIQLMNKDLQTSKLELIKANSSKDKFFSILAHDLRNPFHHILGHSQLLALKYDKLNIEERKQYADEIHNSCEQVNRLLDNLLEWSRTQSQSIEFRPQKLLVNDIINETIDLLLKTATKKSILISNKIDQEITVFADTEMLATIIRNITNNAIKFTPAGGNITIDANLLKNKLQIIIEDNGVGIKKSNINKLFKLHSNIKTRGTNDERGTGLGLAICKEFIDLHQGKIWVESEVNVGSKFYVELPYRNIT